MQGLNLGILCNSPLLLGFLCCGCSLRVDGKQGMCKKTMESPISAQNDFNEALEVSFVLL